MRFTTRPVVMGTHGLVTAGHYLGAMAGQRMLEKGGNAIDAAAAAAFVLACIEPHINGIGGEVPTLIYSAKEKRVFAISGQGCAPKLVTIPWMRENGIELIPGDGFLPATVPAMVDTWATALIRFGSLSLGDVLEAAIELAQDGFPMYGYLQRNLTANGERYRKEWPSTAEVWLPGGRPPGIGELIRQPDWAATFKGIVDIEKKDAHRGREAAIQTARDYFYKGPVAERIESFVTKTAVRDASGREHFGLLRAGDLAGWTARVEEPVNTTYRGLQVFKCPSWTQGPVFLQQLNLLEGFPLSQMEHNSAEYVHTIVECSKLAYADRERHYGDPLFARVPLEALLSKAYAGGRRERVDSHRASGDLIPGDPSDPSGRTTLDLGPAALQAGRAPGAAQVDGKAVHGLPPGMGGDTTHLDAVDRWGNMVAATPSGGWLGSSPVIPGLGFPLGTRGQMFSLDPQHPNSLQPGKRPRATLTPSLALKDGVPWLVFGTPGGDQQDQWTLQFFLNYVEFGMNLQEAIDAPTFHSLHFPSSFYPRKAVPRRLAVEGRIPADVVEELRSRGHDVTVGGDWSHGRVLAIRFDARSGVISGAASPRGETAYVLGR